MWRVAIAICCASWIVPAGPADAEVPADRGVSRTPDGRAVLHRRLPSRAGPGAATSEASAPVFVYDPVRGGTLPEELERDGQTLPRPDGAAAPRPGEAVYRADGVGAAGPGAAEAGAPGATEGAAGATALPGGDGPEAGSPGAVGDVDGPPGAAGELDGGEFGPPDGPTEMSHPGALPFDAAAGFDDPRETLGDRAAPDRATGAEDRLDYRTVFDPSVVPFKRNRALDRVGADYELSADRRTYTRVEITGNRLEQGREAFWGSVVIEGRAGERVPLPSVSPESRILSVEASPAVELSFEKDRSDNFYVTPAAAGRVRLVFVMDAPTGYFGRPIPVGLHVRDVPRALRPRPPASVVREVEQVAREAGIDPAAPYDVLLEALVGWFRGFTPGEPPPAAGSIYRDLTLGRAGVCRHRGFGFVVTAQGLGIPARYVFNEAHVFVEVYVPGPDPGWLRVDLGGGAERLVVHGGADKTLHRPRGRDPFDQPDAFAAQQAAGATRVEGMPSAGRTSAAGASPVDPAAFPEAIRAMLNRAIPRAAAAPHKVPTRVTLSVEGWAVYRGDPLAVSGQVMDARGRPVTDGTLQILLLFGADRQAVALLATALLDADGRYTAEVRVPEQQPPGDYEIVAEFMGNSAHAPAVSD